MNQKLIELKELIEAGQLERMIKFQEGMNGPDPEKAMRLHYKSSIETRIIPGRKYIKVDVGSSGKYMVDTATGEIFGIKGYGQVHKGHRYGTLDTIHEWNWGGYTAFRK